MLAFISHSLCELRVCVSMQVGFFGILSGNIFWEIIRANNYLEFQGKWTQIRGIGFLLIPGAINSDQVRLILKPFWIVGENVTFLFSLFGETSSNFFRKKSSRIVVLLKRVLPSSGGYEGMMWIFFFSLFFVLFMFLKWLRFWRQDLVVELAF